VGAAERLGDQPAAERRPGLLPRQPLPRPPRERPANRVHGRHGRLLGRRRGDRRDQ
jgi:hypothetical protein